MMKDDVSAFYRLSERKFLPNDTMVFYLFYFLFYFIFNFLWFIVNDLF